MAHDIPPDPLGAVFTDEILVRLRIGCADKPTEPLAHRIFILTAHGPIPLDEPAKTRVRYWRAQRAAWDTYVGAAFACGLLAEKHGGDVVSRLTGVDDQNFRSAMAECMAAWFLSGKLKLPVSPRPDGPPGRVPDLPVADANGDITVEVKVPYKPPLDIEVSGFLGDDAPMLAACVDEGNKQFAAGQRNVLLLVARTKLGFPQRHELIKAFFGETKIVVPFDPEIGGLGGEAKAEFFPEGKFLKIWGDKPRFTRISAVVCLGERPIEGPEGPLPQNVWVDHHWIVLHNPFCPHPVSEHIWGECPQLIRDGEIMRWSDGQAVES